IINPDFDKIDSPFQQTSSLKPYVPNVILEKIIIDLEDEVVNFLEKEKVNFETIESLKSKSFESSEKVSSESENQSENDCLVVEKECDKEENPNNRSIIHKHFDKTPYELINNRKPNIKFFRVFECRCYLLNDYEHVRKLKAKGDIRVFVGSLKESAAFKIYNKRTRKIHDSMNVNFDEISEMASKQFSLEPGLSKLNETGKSSNRSVSKVDEASKTDLEDLFQDFYDEDFDSSKIMKPPTTNDESSNVEIPSHEQEVFHEVSKLFQGESSSSSLNDDVQQSLEEVILPLSNTQSIPINMIPNGDEASTSHNVFNERLEDAYFDSSTSFHVSSNVQTYYQPYPHKKKWTKDHPLYKIIGDPKLSVRTRGQLANSCLFSCLLSSIEPANVAEALRDADWVSAMQEELD
nr:hypothetical protein [Tanacetum cinerariifolium]